MIDSVDEMDDANVSKRGCSLYRESGIARNASAHEKRILERAAPQSRTFVPQGTNN